jgi:trehalose 6-phosphate phosphatase
MSLPAGASLGPKLSTFIRNLPKPRETDLNALALFLDVDGTIAEIMPRPWDVVPDSRRSALVKEVYEATSGRLAILSGRTLEDVDRILEGLVPCVAAVHGLVQRMPDGTIVTTERSPVLTEVRERVEEFVARHPGVTVEQKGSSYALHYRAAGQYEKDVRSFTASIAETMRLSVQNGSMVSEIRTPGPNKGTALKLFLERPPFAGFTPVMVGDDLTDEDAFAAAHEMGGYGIMVGSERPSRAWFRIPSVPDVMSWLEQNAVA